MNKIAFYILIILFYLGISKNFGPNSRNKIFIKGENVLSNYFSGSPISVILIRYFESGMIIKTYYHKYKITYGFKKPPHIITVRVSKDFYVKNIDHLGLSIFRRSINKKEESIVPMPPGILYIGDLSFGKWENHPKRKRIWKFHTAYKHFPSVFGWHSFIPDDHFYKQAILHLKNQKAFFGTNNEFGTNSTMNKKIYKSIFESDVIKKLTLKNFFQSYLSITSRWIFNEGEKPL